MKNIDLHQSVTHKLKLIANQEEGVELTKEEAEYLNITSLDDDMILRDNKEGENNE